MGRGLVRGGWVCICAALALLTACGGGALQPTVPVVSPLPPTEPSESTPTIAASAPTSGTLEASEGELPATSTVMATPASVTLAVQPATIAVGETAEVVLTVAEVANLYGVQVLFQFDPALLEVMDASGDVEGVQLEDGDLLEIGFTVVNAADNVAGTATYAVAQMPPSEAVTGSGDLLRFLVRGKAAGSATLEVANIILASAQGEEIPLAEDVAAATVEIR